MVESGEEIEPTEAEPTEAKPTAVPSTTKSRYDFGVVSLATHKSMQGNKRRDTKPEVAVR